MLISDNKKLIIKMLPSLIYNCGYLFAQLDTSFDTMVKILKHQKLPFSRQIYSDDIKLVLSLKKALKYILNYNKPVSLYLYHKINQIVAYDALDPGYFAYKPMQINGAKWQPPVPSKYHAKQFINHYTHLKAPYSIRAIQLMLMFDRYQFFWNGNKRTAWLVSNYYLIQHGIGVINIPLNQKNIWEKLLLNFYDTGNLKPITKWILKNGLITHF